MTALKLCPMELSKMRRYQRKTVTPSPYVDLSFDTGR
jgi:hypothetical protein